MTIEILTVLPELLESPFAHSIMKRAQERGHLNIKLHQLRNWAINKHGQVDDYQYGGGAGMVIMCEPLANAIDAIQKEGGAFDEIIFVTPDGKRFDQKDANTLSLKNRILIICGHYKGIDQRIRDLYVTQEISIGDYVLSGGELASCPVIQGLSLSLLLSLGRFLHGLLRIVTFLNRITGATHVKRRNFLQNDPSSATAERGAVAAWWSEGEAYGLRRKMPRSEDVQARVIPKAECFWTHQ